MTTCSRSAAAVWSRDSRSSCWERAQASSGRSRSTSPTSIRPRICAASPPPSRSTVKDVKEKELPALDDDFASEASEFDTLEELREDIEDKLKAAQERSIEEEFREAVVDAAAAEAQIEIPDELVQARAEEMWHRTEHALEHQNIDPETYLKAAGKTREQMVEEAKPDAAKQLARESVLEAVAEAESIEVSDEELLEVLRTSAEREGASAENLLERLKKSGRDAVRAP